MKSRTRPALSLSLAGIAAMGSTLVGCPPRLGSKGPVQPPTGSCPYGEASDNRSQLVADWSVGRKAIFEALVKGEAKPVTLHLQEGRTPRIVENCRPEGKYVYRATTTQQASCELFAQAQLKANLPFVFGELSAELSQYERIAYYVAAVGAYTLEDGRASIQGNPSCSEATHYVSAVAVGAYVRAVGKRGDFDGDIKATAGNFEARIRAELEQEQKFVTRGGDFSKCSARDYKPAKDELEANGVDRSCGAIIELTLQEVRRTSCKLQIAQSLQPSSSMPIGRCVDLLPGVYAVTVRGAMRRSRVPKDPSQSALWVTVGEDKPLRALAAASAESDVVFANAYAGQAVVTNAVDVSLSVTDSAQALGDVFELRDMVIELQWRH